MSGWKRNFKLLKYVVTTVPRLKICINEQSVNLWGAFRSPGDGGDDSWWCYLEMVPRLPGPDPGPLAPAREGATSGPPSTVTPWFLPPGTPPSEELCWQTGASSRTGCLSRTPAMRSYASGDGWAGGYFSTGP